MPAFGSFLCSLCRRSWPAVAVMSALMLPATGRAGTEPPSPPPLEEIKGDLKALKHGGSPELDGTAAGPKITLPGFLPTAGDSPAPAAPSTAGAPGATTARKPAGANWLLDAMELQTQARQKKRPGAAERGKDETPVADTADPAYLLKLYIAQKPAGGEPPEELLRAGNARPAGRLEAGVLEVFLK